MSKYHVTENLQETVVHLQGRYSLEVRTYSTREGCWNYSGGTILRSQDGIKVATVNRNYPSFPFAWCMGHPNGHDYLVCGEDYQGQTFVELDTGKVFNYRSPGSEKGFGFCWARYAPSPCPTRLAVSGCYWGGPYEVRVYDISDPQNFQGKYWLPHDQETCPGGCGWDDFDSWEPSGSGLRITEEVYDEETDEQQPSHSHLWMPTGKPLTDTEWREFFDSKK